MSRESLKIVILGLSITSSWGNGHATTYRALVRELEARGHRVLFLERDVPWYASNRDASRLLFGQVELYSGLDDLKQRFGDEIRNADFVMVGSYVPEGIAAGELVVETAKGVTCFYDIDTPVTLATLESGKNRYISRELIPRYDLYASFTGGPALTTLEGTFGARLAIPLYCSVDTSLYYPQWNPLRWDLGYLGTYAPDRQPALDDLMIEPARRWKTGRFVVAGPQYPENLEWPDNVECISHVAPPGHRLFYTSQHFTLNVTRADMVLAGYSPSVRLFEAAACGTAIISDFWEGLDTFFEPGKEILVSRSPDETLHYLHDTSDEERLEIGRRGRERVLREHTAAHRAASLEEYILRLLGPQRLDGSA